MKLVPVLSTAFLVSLAAATAFARDAAMPPITVSGSATIASDYRLRVSQTEKEMAIEGGITIAHGAVAASPTASF